MTNHDDKSGRELAEELEGLRRRVAKLERSEKELERLRAELEQGAEAMNVLLENSHDIIAVIKPDGTLKYISPSFERTFGYGMEEMKEENVFDLVHPDDLAEVKEAIAATSRLPIHATSREFRFRHRDGSWHIVEAQGINLTQNPAVAGLVITARDITDRKAMEERLQRSESYYRSLIRNAADMVSVLDADLNFRWGSRSSGRITGYSPEAIYGRNLMEFMHPDEHEVVKEAADFVMANPGVPRDTEGFFLHADGTYHYYSIMVTSLLDDPAVRGIIINARDITERRRMEEKLLAINRELDSFASTVSHDLRTPLSLIEGYAHLLRAEGISGEEREAYLKSITSAVRRMDELTQSLLEYAQAGQSAGAAAPVEPLDVLSDILYEHEAEIEGMGVEVVLGDEFPSILVDRLKLRQVFDNLVGNALKSLAGRATPRLEASVRVDGDTALFCVRDNGPGLKPGVGEAVFLPFKRFGASGAPGLGIGLSTVKRAVEGWGGEVWVESEPGEGAAFFFTAPLE